MEAAVLLGVLGAGYLLNKPSSDNNNNSSGENLPSETDAYDTNYFKKSDEEYKKSIFDSYEKSRIPGANIVNYQNIDKYLNQTPQDPEEDDKYIYSNVTDAKILKENFLVNDQGIKLAPYF